LLFESKGISNSTIIAFRLAVALHSLAAVKAAAPSFVHALTKPLAPFLFFQMNRKENR
jgi:hypothetical protein